MKQITIAGTGMTPLGKFPQRSLADLVTDAVARALEDASARPADIGAIYYANAGQGALEGQFMVGGQIALRSAGFQEIPIVNIENACASASSALYQAAMAVAAGETDIALAVGAEKMTIEDRQRMFSVFDGAWDVHTPAENYTLLKNMAAEYPPPHPDDDSQRSVFMDIYAYLARFHMGTFGTTQRQLATVSAKNHGHSALNPDSQFQNPMTVDEVLCAREIIWPLTLPMCAPVSDGAAAAVVCNADGLARLNVEAPIKLLACVLGSGTDRAAEEFDRHLCRLAALKAYERAGIGPEDIDLAEVHDATAFAEIQQTENLGFCAIGDGGPFAESGATTLGGSIPVNPSGGLQSKGHPIGATGLAQIHELVLQLRGRAGKRQVEGARFAVAENGGGFHGIEEAAACITILGA